MSEDPEVSVADPEGRYIRASLMTSGDVSKRVYRAFDDETAIEVAWVEYSNLSLAVMSKLEERTELLAELNHPNLIKYYKGWADVKNRRFIFITEISTSGSLQRFLRRKVHMKANVMRSWTSQILDGLHYLHCRDPALVHHALTCSSVFISGTVKIGGLELATLLDFYPPAEFHMEPGFEAPDRGDSKNSHALKAIDIYSLGMTLLQMFTNRYPYAECKTISDICQFSQRGKLPRALKKLRNLVAADFIRSCLAPAALRPTTAQLMDHTFLSTDFEQGETLTEEADDDADADANGSDSESDDDNGSLQSSTSINANKRPSTPSTAAAAVVPTLATATIAAAAASASSLAVHKEDIKAYVGDRPSRGLSPRPAGAAGNVSPRPARGDALKVYFDVSGAQASQMDCIRLSLEEVQNVRALKLRIITDLGLHHAVDRAADGTTLALDESEYRASLQSVTDSVDELARIGETVSKIRLKYRDCEGDYVTVAERTPIAEIARHAKSLHVYALHHPATTTTVAAAAASSTAAATTTTSTNEAMSGVLGQSGLRTQGRAMLEERDWVLWLNHILSRSGKKSASGAPIRIANVGRDLADGTVLMHVLEFLIGHALTTKFNISPKNRIQQIDNIIVVFNVIEKEFATQIVGCTPYEVVDANTKRIMGVLNSLAQVARKRLPTLQQPGTIEPTAADEEEEEDDEEDDEDDDEDDDDGATTEPAAASATAAAAAAAPAASAEVTAVDQMKQQFVAGFRRRRDTVSVESVAVAELLRERKEDVVADGSGVNTPSPRSVRDIVSAMNSANPSPRQAQVGSNKSSPRIDVPAAVAVAPEVVVTAVAASEVPTAVEGAAGADAAGTAAPAGEVDAIATLEAQNDTKTRKWKRFSNAMQANNTLGSYAARYKSTDEAAILAAEEADRAALKPDDASHYAADSRRVLVRTTEGSASGDAFDVPVWIEPSATYDDVVCQIDARIWAQQAAGVERHHSNRRRPFSAPLVLYVATKQRGLLGSLADVGEELMPHAIASALADEGDEATYEYRVLVDDPHLLEPAESETQQRKDKRKKRKVKRAAAAAAAVDEGGADGDSAADGAADGVPANGYGTVVRKKRTKVLKKKSGDHDVVDDEGDAEQADDADAATAATVATANGDDATTADSDAAAASATATTATTDDDADDNDDEAVKVSEKKTKTKTKKKSMIAGDSTPTQVRKNEASKADEAVAEQNEEAALAAEAARRALKRNEIAREVLTSERKYVQDGLDVLLAMFLEPLRTNGIVTKEEVKLIFGDIEAIRNYNVMLLDQLEKRMQKWDESQQMGDIFQSAVPFLKVYTVYVNKYNSALETLVECRTKNKKMAAFLEKQTSSARCNGLDIGSYLIMPIQRIPRYVLLLQELLKFTEPAHVDYAGLQMATTKMREVADYVNERKREAENLAQVSLVAKLITGSSETIAAPHRRFVTQAALGVAVTPTTYDATVEPKPYFVVLFNDMLVFAKTNAKIRKGKGAARSVQLASDEQVEECAREHKYVARVMLQHYGLVDGQALTATGGGNDITADTAANDAGWDIVTLTTSVKSSTKKTYPDIASHCLRLEPLLPIHELPLAPDTSADGFLARAFYRLYMSSELEKRQWALALDDAMCALLDSEVSRRLDTIKLARLEATPALAKAAFDNPEKRGTLYKRGKDGQWKERVFVLQGPLLFYCKPAEKHESARAIDVRMSSVRLSPRDSVAARERSYSLAVQSPERLFEVAPADVAGAEIECYQWIFALRAATTRHVILAPETAGSAKQKAKRRGESETLRRTDGHLRALDEILRHKYNMRCHDCSADAINWVSMTSGAVLCDACASVHVQLPKGVSQLRSIGMSKWDDETVVQFRQANLAVLKRLRAAAGDDESGVPAAGTDSTPLTPRSDVFAVAANSVVRQSSGSPVKRELRRPSPNATFAARSAYIARLYCTLADARKPPSLTPLDSMDGFLWRRPSAVAAWRRETFRLRGSNLDFEKAKAIGHTVETISLQAAEIRAPRTSDRAHAFDLVTPTRIYSLAADDQDELCRWCLAIQFSVESQK